MPVKIGKALNSYNIRHTTWYEVYIFHENTITEFQSKCAFLTFTHFLEESYYFNWTSNHLRNLILYFDFKAYIKCIKKSVRSIIEIK